MGKFNDYVTRRKKKQCIVAQILANEPENRCVWNYFGIWKMIMKTSMLTINVHTDFPFQKSALIQIKKGNEKKSKGIQCNILLLPQCLTVYHSNPALFQTPPNHTTDHTDTACNE